MTLLEEIAQKHTNDVVYATVSLTIEKIAAEAAREILSDPAFREQLKTLAGVSVARAFRDLAKNGRKRSTRKR